MPLTQKSIENAKPGLTPTGRKTSRSYKMGDSLGLYLEVAPHGGKWWRLKYRLAEKEKRVSLGIYPEVSLDEAREKRDNFRALIANGIDPSNYLKEDRAARREAKNCQLAATRFTLDNEGSLSFRLGKRRLTLTPQETIDLRAFLDATRSVTIR